MLASVKQKRERDARFWDWIARRYSRKPVPDWAVYQTKLKTTNMYLKQDDLVLEVGCGTGTTALYHAPHVARIDATDISPKMIGIAEAKANEQGIKNVSFSVSSIDALSASPGHYDVVLAHSVLHLLADPSCSLRRLHRVLKPGGLLIMSTPCIADFAPWLRWIAPVGHLIGVMPRINVFRQSSFLRWLGDAGFECEKVWQPKRDSGVYMVARAHD